MVTGIIIYPKLSGTREESLAAELHDCYNVQLTLGTMKETAHNLGRKKYLAVN